MSHNASYVSSLGNVTASDDKSYAYSTVLTDTLSTNKMSNYFSGTNCNGTDCIVSASCNTSNGWYSSTASAGTYRRSVTVSSTVKAKYAKGTDAVCYHKAQCSDYDGYADSCPSGQTGTKVTIDGTNGLQCYKTADCRNSCNDGYYYYSNPDTQFDEEEFYYMNQWGTTYGEPGCYEPRCQSYSEPNPVGETNSTAKAQYDDQYTATSLPGRERRGTGKDTISQVHCFKPITPTHMVLMYRYTGSFGEGRLCITPKRIALYKGTEEVTNNFRLAFNNQGYQAGATCDNSSIYLEKDDHYCKANIGVGEESSSPYNGYSMSYCTSSLTVTSYDNPFNCFNTYITPSIYTSDLCTNYSDENGWWTEYGQVGSIHLQDSGYIQSYGTYVYIKYVGTAYYHETSYTQTSLINFMKAGD